jgi:hypothetical protein
MPDDTFALSTISPSLPADADYDAVLTAVMATMRGRWFLAEYSRRNRNADTGLMLEAIERIEAVIRNGQTRDANQSVRIELLEMARTIAQTRADVAEIKPDAAPGDKATQPETDAESDIFAAAERLQDTAWSMRERGLDMATCDQISELAGAILTASSLRDPSNQRTQKLGEVLKYLERRIDAMLDTAANGRAGSAPQAGMDHAGRAPHGGNGHDPEAWSAATHDEQPSAQDHTQDFTQESTQDLAADGDHTDADRGVDPLADVAAAMAALMQSRDVIIEAQAEPESPTAPDAEAVAAIEAADNPDIRSETAAADAPCPPEPSPPPPATEPDDVPALAAELAPEPVDFLLAPLDMPLVARAPVRHDLVASEPEPEAAQLAPPSSHAAEAAPRQNDPLAALKAMSDAERIALFT